MIDWFTVVAQIINFLILVALLKYFLYGRIVAAMTQRQEEISARWEEARQQREAAAKELEAARDRNRQLDQQREALLANAPRRARGSWRNQRKNGCGLTVCSLGRRNGNH